MLLKIHDSLNVDRNIGEPLYQQLYEQIKNLIANGTLLPNEKLPPIRSLSERLGVNNVTVINAYKMLESNGYAYSKAGSGTFVRPSSALPPSMVVGSKPSGIVPSKDESLIDFSTSTPNAELFPIGDFKDMLNQVLDRDGGGAFSYQEIQGYYPLREALRSYFTDNGITSALEDIHIISGAQQGIDIAAKTIVGFNDTIVIESPTYTGAIAVFRSRGANIVEIPIEEDGINTEELEQVLKSTRVKLIYVMTSYQNPTGVSYSEDKKLQLLYLAHKYDTYILEDDYLSELRFSSMPTLPIKALDGNDRVIYIKSFSKIFMPGLRLGAVIAPSALTEGMLSSKQTTDISSSSLMQRAFDLYLREKKWHSHILYMQEAYKERYGAMKEALRVEFPQAEYMDPKGGIHMWVKTSADSSILGSAAREKGVVVAPGSIFYVDERKSNHFRLSFAAEDKESIVKGVRLLKEAYDEAIGNL